MMKRSGIFRHKMIVLSILIFLALLSGNPLAGQDLLQLIPNDAISVMILRPPKFLSTLPGVFLKRFLSDIDQARHNFFKSVRTTSIDPRTFSEVAIYISPNFDKNTQEHCKVFLARGPISVSQIRKSAQTASPPLLFKTFFGYPAIQESHLNKDSRLGALFFNKDFQPRSILVFPDEHTLLFGEEKDIKAVLAVRNGKRPNILKNHAMKELLKPLDLDVPLWGGGILSENQKMLLRKTGRFFPFAELLEIHFALNTRDGLFCQFVGFLGSKEATETLMKSLRAWARFGKDILNYPDIEGKVFVVAWNNLTIKADEQHRITVSLQISQQLIDRLQDILKRYGKKSPLGKKLKDLDKIQIDMKGNIIGIPSGISD